MSLVSYRFLPPRMGGQRGIALFNEFLSRQLPFACITVKANEGYPVAYHLLPVLSDSRLRYANPLYITKLGSYIRRHRITHLIIEHPYYGWLGTLLKWIYGVKLIVHSHNMEHQRFRSLGKWWWKLLYQYERWTHRRASLSFFITEEDRQTALQQFGLKEKDCITVTYGIEWDKPPGLDEKEQARQQLLEYYGWNSSTVLYLFNGTLDYLPNLAALDIILQEINPRLQKTAPFPYKILVCGNRLPAAYQELKDHPNILYAGFVDDISLYFKAAAVFLNPVNEGGGIKTKLVEAIGYGCQAVSTANGAIGVDPSICNGKLAIAEGWEQFAAAAISMALKPSVAGQPYFDHFYWGNIAARAAAAIRQLTTKA